MVHAQAGVILQTLQEFCSEHNYTLPLDLGAKGSCCVGGNVATNAGGTFYSRYGSLAANLVGLEVVTADGRVLDLNFSQRTNLKDNTGYPLHHLFLGSEGTLGVITGVALQCRPKLPVQQTAWLALRHWQQVPTVISKAQRHLGEILAAAEWMDGTAVSLVAATHPDLHIPLLVPEHGNNDDSIHKVPLSPLPLAGNARLPRGTRRGQDGSVFTRRFGRRRR